MATAQTLLNEAQQRLRDTNARIWTRAELLDYLNEGYRRLCLEASLPGFLAYNTPPRWPYGVTAHWERDQVAPARAWVPFLRFSTGVYIASYRWEIEHLAGTTPSASKACITAPWEFIYEVTDRFLPFVLPADHVRTMRSTWDDVLLSWQTIKPLDQREYAWWEDTGLPTYVFGTNQGQLGVFPLDSSYTDGYVLAGDARFGTPRQFSGARTYSFASQEPSVRAMNAHTSPGDADVHRDSVQTALPMWRFTLAAGTPTVTHHVTQAWEKDQIEAAATLSAGTTRGTFSWEQQHGATNVGGSFLLGMTRQFAGTVQYLPRGNYGSPRAWHSSADSLFLLYARIPTALVQEAESPSDLPARLHKYLRIYVVSRAFDREGPAHNDFMASMYRSLFNLGVRVVRRMAWATMVDQTPQRATLPTPRDRTPPRVHFPASFPAVWR